jgi:hypothetical protein
MVIIDVGRYDNMSVSDELNKIYKMLSKQLLFYPSGAQKQVKMAHFWVENLTFLQYKKCII